MIARMAADTRYTIVAAAAEDGATLEHDDLIDLGRTQQQVRAFGAIALAAALARSRPRPTSRIGASSAALTLAPPALSLSPGSITIGLACVGVASLF